MSRNGTRDINDYIDDYEQSAKDYAEMGPMWAELVFPDDDDALKALFGGCDSQDYDQDEDDQSYRR